MTPSVILFDFGASAAETVVIARTVSVMLANHPHPNLREPAPKWLTPLSTLDQSINALEESIRLAANKDVLMIKDRDEKQGVVKKQLTQIGKFVELAVDGDREAIRQSGYPLRPLPAPKPAVELPPAPVVTLSHGGTCTLMAKCSRYSRANSYRLQITDANPEVETNYRDVDDFPRATKMQITGLVPGRLYWVRASILAPSGRGPWSLPVSLRCL